MNHIVDSVWFIPIDGFEFLFIPFHFTCRHRHGHCEARLTIDCFVSSLIDAALLDTDLVSDLNSDSGFRNIATLPSHNRRPIPIGVSPRERLILQPRIHSDTKILRAPQRSGPKGISGNDQSGRKARMVLVCPLVRMGAYESRLILWALRSYDVYRVPTDHQTDHHHTSFFILPSLKIRIQKNIY